MRIRDGYARLSGDKTVHEIDDNGLEIMGSDDYPLWSLRLNPDGSLEVRAVSCARHGDGPVLDTKLMVAPQACNSVVISRMEYPA